MTYIRCAADLSSIRALFTQYKCAYIQNIGHLKLQAIIFESMRQIKNIQKFYEFEEDIR